MKQTITKGIIAAAANHENVSEPSIQNYTAQGSALPKLGQEEDSWAQHNNNECFVCRHDSICKKTTVTSPFSKTEPSGMVISAAATTVSKMNGDFHAVLQETTGGMRSTLDTDAPVLAAPFKSNGRTPLRETRCSAIVACQFISTKSKCLRPMLGHAGAVYNMLRSCSCGAFPIL